MEVLHARCAGLDVHKDMVAACIRVVEGGKVRQEVRQFGTATKDLLTLADWLSENECTHVAMEATGVYWRPVWHVLEEDFTLVLANAMHIRNVPGRKTDVADATWISDLLAHGLIRPSFVPERPIQEMRTLTRTRKQLVRERGQHVQRIQKVLEDANLKLASVASDITGLTGRRILDALVEGETNPEELLRRAGNRLKAKRETILAALQGHFNSHHRFMVRLHLGQIDGLDAAIASVEQEVGSVLEPFRAKASLLTTIPGISDTAAEVIVSEIGIDMSRFPTAAHLVSWAGLCPRSDESAGKRRSTRLRKGAPWLKTVLVQTAWAASRSTGTYLRAQFLRLKSRRGPMKAICAVAASILTAAYYMLRDDVEYRELGGDFFDTQEKGKTTARLVRRLQELGFQVDLREVA
jgi:transposase